MRQKTEQDKALITHAMKREIILEIKKTWENAGSNYVSPAMVEAAVLSADIKKYLDS